MDFVTDMNARERKKFVQLIEIHIKDFENLCYAIGIGSSLHQWSVHE